MNTDDSAAQNDWLHSLQNERITERFSEIRTYAYMVFDQLDTNGNGFLELEEIAAAMNLPQTSTREKSFLAFLLDNHDAIAESHEDGATSGISRADIESYFKLISELM